MRILIDELVFIDALARVFLLVAGGATLALATASWAVRTRKLRPFGAPARFVRGRVDPIFVPMERRLLRYGANPTMAPWWTLGAVVIGGIVIISLLGFVREQILRALLATQLGPRGYWVLLVSWTFALLRLALLVRVLSSWLQLGQYSPWVRWAWVLTEWFLAPLRRVLPNLGMIDVTPIVAYFALSLVESALVRLG